MTLWFDLDVVRKDWDDAMVSDELLTALLEAAQDAVTAYAPSTLTTPLADLTLPITIVDDETGEESADSANFPARLRAALMLHVREIWRDTERDGGVVGVGDYVVRADDMTRAVKRLLRPRNAVPKVR